MAHKMASKYLRGSIVLLEGGPVPACLHYINLVKLHIGHQVCEVEIFPPLSVFGSDWMFIKSKRSYLYLLFGVRRLPKCFLFCYGSSLLACLFDLI